MIRKTWSISGTPWGVGPSAAQAGSAIVEAARPSAISLLFIGGVLSIEGRFLATPRMPGEWPTSRRGDGDGSVTTALAAGDGPQVSGDPPSRTLGWPPWRIRVTSGGV